MLRRRCAVAGPSHKSLSRRLKRPVGGAWAKFVSFVAPHPGKGYKGAGAEFGAGQEA